MRYSLLVATSTLLTFAACGGGQHATNFPTRSELAEIAAAPAPKRVADKGAIDADTWELKGALPDAIEEAPAEGGPWTQVLAAAIAGKPNVVASRAIQCVAREGAAFLVEKGALPAEPLRRFMAARCGVANTGVLMGSQIGTVPQAIGEAEVVAKWGPPAAAALQKALGAGDHLAGIAFARNGDKAAIVYATAEVLARVDRVPFVPTGGSVVLSGSLTRAADHVEALVTRGRFGYVPCATNPATRPPQFSVSCPVAADDAAAWIEIAAFPPGRVLGMRAVEALVFPGGTPQSTYARPRGGSAPPGDKGGVIASLVGRVNAVRREASLAPLRVSAAESRTADLLAPHYFASVAGLDDPAVGDKIALGLQAGWDVEGLIREGHFASAWGEAMDPDALLATALERPFARQALLAPDVEVAAVGALVPEGGGGMGVVFGTYAIADATKAPNESAAVLARITRVRAERGLAPPTMVPALAGVAAKAAQRVDGGEDPNDAVKWLVARSVEGLTRGSVKAWVSQAGSVDQIQLPPELTSTAGLNLAVATAHYRQDGEPWAKLVVLVVAWLDGPAMTATRAAPPRG